MATKKAHCIGDIDARGYGRTEQYNLQRYHTPELGHQPGSTNLHAASPNDIVLELRVSRLSDRTHPCADSDPADNDIGATLRSGGISLC